MLDRPTYIYVLILAPLLFLLTVLRLLQVIKQTHAGERRPGLPNPPAKNKAKQTCRIVAFLGSGGHTGEMVRLLYALDFAKYTHRTYVISSGDHLSLSKARDLEAIKSRGKQHGEGVCIRLCLVQMTFSLTLLPFMPFIIADVDSQTNA